MISDRAHTNAALLDNVAEYAVERFAERGRVDLLFAAVAAAR